MTDRVRAIAFGMTWKPVTTEERTLFRQVMLWIRTVRATGERYGLSSYGADWLPSDSDFDKSALLERIRSGLAPMDEPPPVGYSCPWYALVEDAGPHYVFDVHFDAQFIGADEALVAQNLFKIYERLGDKEFIVGDKRGTSYRFRLWFDPDWYPRGSTLPIEKRPRGGWFMQNIALASVDTHAKRGDSTQIGAPSPMGSAVGDSRDAQPLPQSTRE